MRRPLLPLLLPPLLVVALLLPAAPAAAHGTGPTVVPVLDDVEGDLPDGVAVEVVASQAAPLLAVTNPSSTVLEVEDDRGRGWLRISAAGVEVNTGVPDTYTTTSPEGGSVPDDVRRGDAPDAWVAVSAEPSWSWFEHRLHPAGLLVPPSLATVDREREIADWAIDVTAGRGAGAAQGRIVGRIVHRPPGGTVVAALDGDLPDGITAEALSGSVPGIFLGLDGAQEVLVLGTAGEPFLRFAADGVEANVRSPSFAVDATARGSAPPTGIDAAADPEWVAVAGVPRHAWLEGRARAALDLPAEVLAAQERRTLAEWAVPLQVDGADVVLAGRTTYLPAGTSPLDPAPGPSVPWIPIAIAVLLVAVAVPEIRRRRRA